MQHADDPERRAWHAPRSTAVALKAECLQATGSFKLRGALHKVAALGQPRRRPRHGERRQPRARGRARRARFGGSHARSSCRADAAVSKVAAVERLGATVQLGGGSVEEALQLAAESGAEPGPRSCIRSTTST